MGKELFIRICGMCKVYDDPQGVRIVYADHPPCYSIEVGEQGEQLFCLHIQDQRSGEQGEHRIVGEARKGQGCKDCRLLVLYVNRTQVTLHCGEGKTLFKEVGVAEREIGRASWRERV